MPKLSTNIDRKSASRLLGISVRTIDRYIRNGKIFAHQENGRIWLDRNEIMNFSHRQIPIMPVAIDKRQKSARMLSKKHDETGFYKDLYGEAKRAMQDYQQKFEQANYRIGQLESQIVHPVSAPKIIPHHDDFVATEIVRRDLYDREKELVLLKERLKQEQVSRVIFAVLTYLLLAMLPLIWYLLR